MATKSKDKTKIATRKPWGRLSDDVKEKILCEINSGMLSKSAPSRKYGLPRSTIGLWFEKRNLAILAQASSSNVLSAMDENQETRLLKKKIDELKQDIKEYIRYYNNDRIKLNLKGMSPIKYRAQH